MSSLTSPLLEPEPELSPLPPDWRPPEGPGGPGGPLVAPEPQHMSGGKVQWQELHGFKVEGDANSQDGWKRLLPSHENGDLLNDELRRTLVMYGELEHSLTDGFDNRKDSGGYGQPWFAAGKLLETVLPLSSEARGRFKVLQYIEGNAGLYNLDWADAVGLDELDDIPDRRRVMGFCAVGPRVGDAEADAVDLVFAWRGTMTVREYVSDAVGTQMVFWEHDDAYGRWGQPWGVSPVKGGEPMLHNGWRQMYRHSLPDPTGRVPPTPYDVVHARLLWALETMNVKSVTTCGHSMGSVFTTISSFDIGRALAEYDAGWCEKHGMQVKPWPSNWKTKKPPLVTAFAYGGPRVGDIFFRDHFMSLPNLRLLRIVNFRDFVTMIPGLTSTTCSGWCCLSYCHPPLKNGELPCIDLDSTAPQGQKLDGLKRAAAYACSFLLCFNVCYFHVGQRLLLDTLSSTVFKPFKLMDVGLRHSMEVHLWLLQHQHAPPSVKEPDSAVAAKGHELRDLRLVNKREAPLKEEFKVEEAWFFKKPAPLTAPITPPDWSI